MVAAIQQVRLGDLPAEPLFSVLISSYNYERYVGAAIESVLNQTHQRFEVIVCDDGSSDSSCEVIERYVKLDSRVRLIRKTNGGQASALNTAYAAASGDLVGYLDSDDEWYPERLAAVIDEFRRRPEAGLVSHQSRVVGPDGTDVGVPQPVQPADGWLAPGVLQGQSPVVLQAWMSLRREVAELVFPLPEILVTCPDLAIGARGLLITPLAGLPRPLGIWRKHGRNQSGGLYTRAGGSVADLDVLLDRVAQTLEDTARFCERVLGVQIGADVARGWERSSLAYLHLERSRMAGTRLHLDAIRLLAGRRLRQWELLYRGAPALASRLALWWYGQYDRTGWTL